MQPLALARLLRLPNVFTAFSDIALGLCVALGIGSAVVDMNLIVRAILLFLASGCLYCSGMVWNDFFDLEEDRRDRPFRPLASGKFSTRFAVLLASSLMGVAILAAWGSSRFGESQDSIPVIYSLCLIGAIFLYDGWLKNTQIGPVSMGFCRFLNVLLGLTLVEDSLSVPAKIHLAMVIGLYIVGVTWFARTEEKRSDSRVLKYAALVMFIAMLLALMVPSRVPTNLVSPLFPYLLVLFTLIVGRRVWAAIEKPTPDRVQAGVKRCILGLVVLDAILATAFVGTSGLLIIFLLPPGLLLGKWVYST